MKVYIKGLNNFPVDDWGIAALNGFRQKGADIHIFEDIEQVPLNRNTLLVSYIDETRKFFKDMDFHVPEDMSFPEELRKINHLWKRKIEYVLAEDFKHLYHLAEAQTFVETPFFCKPANVLKGFNHGIVDTLETFKAIVDTGLDVIISEIVEFEAEYRCFIIDKKIVSCQFYLGDFELYPNLSLVKSAIDCYKSAPIGYSIDVGVLDTGKTALIECNDGWSLGDYGCPPKIYTRLLAERWREILMQNPLIYGK